MFDREVFMGKKKRQKTKELSVAIAEASSKGGDTQQQQQQQPQPQPPRKRGRPRKVVVVETESELKKVEPKEEPEAFTCSATKKEQQHGKQQEELTSESVACKRITKEEIQIPKGEPSRSRARRKSKPRKST